MKKIVIVFIIIMLIGIMFTGCDNKEVAVESEAFHTNGRIIYEDVITENVITENVISWDDVT